MQGAIGRPWRGFTYETMSELQDRQSLFCSDLRALRFAVLQGVALAQLDRNLPANRWRSYFARRRCRNGAQVQAHLEPQALPDFKAVFTRGC